MSPNCVIHEQCWMLDVGDICVADHEKQLFKITNLIQFQLLLRAISELTMEGTFSHQMGVVVIKITS